MKLIFIAFFAALVFSAAVSAQSEKQKAAIEREIRKLDAAHADADPARRSGGDGQDLDDGFQSQQPV